MIWIHSLHPTAWSRRSELKKNDTSETQPHLKMNKADHTISVPFDPKSITNHVDTSCRAVYVQFTSKPVARTLDCSRGNETVTVDMDSEGQAVGVEAIGLKSLSIN